MNTLDSISDGMKRFANRRYILPLLIVLIPILFFMERGPFGSAAIKALSGGSGTLDMTFGYSASQAHGLLARIGREGRQIYTKLLGLDFLFAAVYMMLQSLLITALMNNANLPTRLEKLNLLPFLRSALDTAENCLIMILISGFPSFHPTVAVVASGITVIKLALNYFYIAIVFFLGALTTSRTIQMKKHDVTERGRVA